MTGGFLDGDIFRGLAFRILLFLTLALLPFGLIAVVQTREIARQAEYNSELSLLELTGQASTAERSVLQEGFGAAQALSAVALIYGPDRQRCSDFLSAYKTASRVYTFIGFLSPDGIMQCSSEGGPIDFSKEAGENLDLVNPKRSVIAFDAGSVSERPVIVLNQPFFLQGEFAGYMVLSVLQNAVETQMIAPLQSPPVDVITFNAQGDIVRSNRTQAIVAQNLPKESDLTTLIGQPSRVFESISVGEEDRVYAVVPLVAGVAYSMSIWRANDLQTSLSSSLGLSTFLPVLMWLASLVVAFWSLNRLAVRHIRKLGRQMRHFSYNRRVPRTTLGSSVPKELVEIQKTFARMADSIVRDEAALEDSLRDKNILLKEVHHRVKNNLQLISSIMNMQIRRAQSDDARQVLKRLQERILSLATVHKNLYQSDALDRVEANVLLQEIIAQLLIVGLPAGSQVKVEQHYDTFEMDADDAAPFTLLVSEAVTNALKYIGEPSKGGQAYLSILLEKTDESTIRFRISNSTTGAQGSEGTGLGTQLISAFARQLNGTVNVNFENEEHELVLTFPLVERTKDTYDF